MLRIVRAKNRAAFAEVVRNLGFVVTVRTYWNGAEAALAKSLLDDYGVFCALADENAHLYVPYAAPIRLVVDEDRVDRARHILDGHPEEGSEIEEISEPSLEDARATPTLKSGNPWELLVIAFFFILPAICILQIKRPEIADPSRTARYVIARVDTMHFLAWLAIALAGCLIILYVRVLRSRDVEELPELPSNTGQHHL